MQAEWVYQSHVPENNGFGTGKFGAIRLQVRSGLGQHVTPER